MGSWPKTLPPHTGVNTSHFRLGKWSSLSDADIEQEGYGHLFTKSLLSVGDTK
jgi:hypothetical protein